MNVSFCHLFKFQCPKKWDSLTSTDKPDVRFCEECRENVYLCESAEAMRSHATQNHCIAMPIQVLNSNIEENEWLMGDLVCPDEEFPPMGLGDRQ